jgi:hypothetical protein
MIVDAELVDEPDVRDTCNARSDCPGWNGKRIAHDELRPDSSHEVSDLQSCCNVANGIAESLAPRNVCSVRPPLVPDNVYVRANVAAEPFCPLPRLGHNYVNLRSGRDSL